MLKKLLTCAAIVAPMIAHAQNAGNYTPVPMQSLAAQVAPLLVKQNFANVALDNALVQGGALGTTITDMQQQTATAMQNIGATNSNLTALQAASVMKTQIGQPSGVAGLDPNGNATAPVLSSQGQFGTSEMLGAWAQPGADPFRGYESALFGGFASTGLGNNTFNPRSVLIQADPYGPYSAGCGQGVAIGSGYTSQYPVSEAPPANGASSVVGVGGFDTVANCTLVGNTPARLILPVASYTASSLVLSSPLTAAQAAQIHPNMYVTTNSINPALATTTTAGQLPPRNLYAGFVNNAPHAGDTSISIYAWDVPGIGTGVSGQVPSTSALDTAYSNYGSPVAFFGGGAAGSMFAHNWFYNLSASDLTPSASNKSLIRQFTPLEVDLNIDGTAPNNSVFWSGINMNAGGQPNALTSNSHQMYLGGVINHHLILDGGCGNWDLEANGVFIPNASCGIGSSNTAQMSQEWDQFVDGANVMRMLLWNGLGNPTAPTGWQQAVVHFGPTVDGTQAQKGDSGGSKQGDVEFNQGGIYGGISLCGYGANCGLNVDGGGDTWVEGGHTLWIKPATLANNLQFGFQAIDSYTMGLVSNIGAGVTMRISGDLQSTGGSDGNGSLQSGGSTVISGLHPDGHGGWQVTSNTSTGGTIAMASYTLATLPPANTPDGGIAFCSDCKLNGVTGVLSQYHWSDSKWHDMMNGTLTN